MDPKAQLMLAKQSFDELRTLCEPEDVTSWCPTGGQRTRYAQLCMRVLNGVDRFERLERKGLFLERRLLSLIPATLLTFLREEVKPRAHSIQTALDHLDPEGKELRALFDEPKKSRQSLIRGTFETGLDQVYDLLERNPDWEWGENHRLVPDQAYEVLDSKLIQFEPDDWVNRLNDLSPIRTDKANLDLPIHVRFRLEEAYRAYVFGLWLSVLGISRAILEYCILDNLHKFKLEAKWANREGERRAKTLSHLIEELAEHVPQYRESMTLLRDFGNDYIHPKKSRTSKEMLMQRQSDAKRAIILLYEVVEGIYLTDKVA
jgi:hypothetical protein